MFHSQQREIERLAALERYDLLDTPREEVFDRIVHLACRLLNVPMAAVSAIDGHRQWYKASHGLADTEVPRSQTFCVHALAAGGPMVVADATADERFMQNPFVTGDAHVRAYAGIPLATREGHGLGTICAIDTSPRDFTPDELDSLADLAFITMDALEHRLLANVDPMTGILARRAFKEEAARAVSLALRHHHPLSAIVLDLDHFKAINDASGHAAGDRVISEALHVCTLRLRQGDISGRLGGEEFAFILPHTDRAAAADVAEQLRQAIAGLSVDAGGEPLRFTGSFGIAALDSETRDLDELLRRADLALYEAKAEGRNRCKIAPVAAGAAIAARRRVLKGGQIIFNNRASTVDCTVRSLSDTGAGIDLSSSAGLPKEFMLSIRADSLELPCRVTSWAERHIEVDFMQRAA